MGRLSFHASAACAIALLATATIAGAAAARPLDDITVQAPRLESWQVGRSYTGSPIDEVALSVRVDTAGLDLATPAGLSEVQKRVHRASRSACEEISRLYPLAEPSDTVCAAVAERGALEQVREAALGLPTRVRVLEFAPSSASHLE